MLAMTPPAVNPSRIRWSAVILIISVLLLPAGSRAASPDAATGFLMATESALQQMRGEHGLPSLTRTSALDRVAQRRLEMFQERGSAEHQPQDDELLRQAADAAVDADMKVAENVAVNLENPTQIINAWLGSPLHRRNLLDRDYTQFGLAAGFLPTPDRPVAVLVAVLAGPQTPEPARAAGGRAVAISLVALTLLAAMRLLSLSRS